MARNICGACGWDHASELWPTVNRHHFLDTGRYLSCARDERGSTAAEYLVVNLLIVAGVLVMSWGPLVYLMGTVSMHQGGAV